MPDAGDWIELFASYRITAAPRDEIIHGELRPGVDLGDPEVRRVVEAWEGPWYAVRLPDRTELALVRPLGPDRSPRVVLHGVLLLLTLFTTLAAGALLEGVDPLRAVPVGLGPVWLPVPTGVDWVALTRGAPFAVTLLAILLAHEFGHYVAARRHRLRVTLPYFIPFPPYLSVVGTLGAFIRVRSPVINRRILLDVGVAGPAASFLVSIPVLLIGFRMSHVAPVGGDPVTPFVIPFAGEPLWIGNSLLLALLAPLPSAAAAGSAIVLHPVAFAGWLGLFVTALNLLPLGQLDGGHILYAVAGERQRWVATALLFLLVPLGWLWWGWWLWLAVAVVLGRGRLGHPRVLQDAPALGPGRRALGWVAIVFFLLTFVPVPVRL
ncbi:MAG: site-2 protease family protein [Gemmatimonadetes bacterium]|nr:site-2 protease family protein [Gemmatimonadota bacterium]